MAGPFDVTTKYLVQTYPEHWLGLLGVRPRGPIEVVDADLSTVAAEADKVIRIDEPTPWLVHVEFQSSYDPTIGLRLGRYNIMLALEHRLPVRSVLVLLRPAADGPATSGQLRLALPEQPWYLEFRHEVVRVWREPAERFLVGPLGTLPLAPIADVAAAELPSVVRRLEERLEREAEPNEARTLEVVTYTLLGLRYRRELIEQLLPGVHTMRDSTTYQAILEEGRAEGRAEWGLRVLLRLGERRFGPPGERARAELAGLRDPARIEELTDRLLDAGSWEELLGGR